MSEIKEVELGRVIDGGALSHVAKVMLVDAIDLASDQDRLSWITASGKRVAAIVPVADAEYLIGMASGQPGYDAREREDG
jgi:hypothetical protein